MTQGASKHPTCYVKHVQFPFHIVATPVEVAVRVTCCEHRLSFMVAHTCVAARFQFLQSATKLRLNAWGGGMGWM